jgi:DNA-binding IclR family transcriptional regulator
MPPETTRAFIDEDLRQFRDGEEDPATQRKRFEAEIVETRRRGLARATNPGPSPIHQGDVNAFSAPIYDARGKMVCALSLTSSASRLPPDCDGPVPVALVAAAEALSRRLGFQGHDANLN